jgi:hypothetical protein
VDGVTVAVLGLGATVTVVIKAAPVHPLTAGVMVNITLADEFVVLVSVPEMLPVPEDGRPVTEAVLFLVQAYVVLDILLVSNTGVIAVPEQIVWEVGVAAAVGLGLTSTETLLEQLFVVGVTVNVTYKGAVVVLVNVPLIVPDPLFAIPVTPAVLFLVQLYVAPPPAPLNVILLMGDPEQTDWIAGVLLTTFEFEFTVTVAVMAVPVQPFAVGVMVNVTVTGEPVVLVKVPVILAEVPLEAIPVTEPVLFLVQE